MSQDDISGGSACEVWDCSIALGGESQSMILKVFTPGFADVSKIGPVNTARKCALALSEMPKHAVPTPRLFGFAQQGECAAILVKKITPVPWNSNTRIEAAKSLARLHELQLCQLDDKLIDLIGRSAPNRCRTLLGLTELVLTLDMQHSHWRKAYPGLAETVSELLESGEPCSDMRTLVHGDFFSANLLLGSDGLSIIDWEMLALGDPMWDLGFLIGADRGLPSREVDRVIATYSSQRPVDTPVLVWHKKCWDSYWALRNLARQLRSCSKCH